MGSMRPVKIFAQLIRKKASTPVARNNAYTAALVESRTDDRMLVEIEFALCLIQGVTSVGNITIEAKASQYSEIHAKVPLSRGHMARFLVVKLQTNGVSTVLSAGSG